MFQNVEIEFFWKLCHRLLLMMMMLPVDGKARSLLYISRIDVIDTDGYEGCFLRRVSSQVGFGRPSFVVDEKDCHSFSKEDVIKKTSQSSVSQRQPSKVKPACVQYQSE